MALAQRGLGAATPDFIHFTETIMKRYFNVIRVVAITVALSFAAGACNTIQGAGKDIERGGQKIERAADKAKD
jgi:entericidin B